MVRVFIKGGVWKNSEDEILKAAVMKYGKQQWARVASLLNRKSAKQCKARWHEWLDPSVRKVEWSRAEEEKLLHLAKLMPAQWKTIGPLVGRTASQCQEHYEQLLDEAASASNADAPALGDGSGTDAATSDELRQRTQQALRPGQIDSHPETKPARPDPIDMDEDEIEMLQEARARLANTQGKKAKRKQREKMLAEAKRLADLQKRRELKQAGLLSSAARKKSRKKNKDIDLGVEIPFHKPAPAGFHDVSAEADRTEHIRNRRLKEVDFKKINENEYRSRDKEAKQAEKREEARLRNLERSNMQYVVAQVSKTNDPLAKRKRGVLELPAPTISDTELQHLAKLTDMDKSNANAAATTSLSSNNAATGALLGDYSDRPLPTPMRTPLQNQNSESTQETIFRQASNLRLLERGQTPLLGGEDPNLEAQEHTSATTSTSASISAYTTTGTNASVSAATPLLRDRGVGQTPMSVAPRDELGLNRPRSEFRGATGDEDTASLGASTFATSTMSIKELAREERRAAKRARRDLEDALSALPAPQFEYELAAPEDIKDDGDDRPMVETVEHAPDAADLDAADRSRQRREAERLYEARSSVMKRSELPRPTGVIPHSYTMVANETSSNKIAESLIRAEMVTLLRHDAYSYPTANPLVSIGEDGKKKKKRKNNSHVQQTVPTEVSLDHFEEESLDTAKDLMQVELDAVLKERVLSAMSNDSTKSESSILEMLCQENSNASTDGASKLLYLEVDDQQKWVVPPKNIKNHAIATFQAEFAALNAATAAIRKKNDKIESKLGVKNGGYAKREESMLCTVLDTFAQYQNSKIEEAVFANLKWHEERGGVLRIERLKEEVALLEEDEAKDQKQYGDLLLEKKRLTMNLKHLSTK